MDVRLPGMDGIAAITQIRAALPGARILVVSSCETEGHIVRALRAGAAGYAPKSSSRRDLLAAIRVVHAGGRHVPPDVAVRAAALLGEEPLTERELQVLELVREGHRNKQVAARLGIAESTVSFHIRNLGLKLGANDRAHAVTIAVRRGLLAL